MVAPFALLERTDMRESRASLPRCDHKCRALVSKLQGRHARRTRSSILLNRSAVQRSIHASVSRLSGLEAEREQESPSGLPKDPMGVDW